MRFFTLQTIALATLCAAQNDLATVISSQPDLSTLLELVTLANLTDTLSSASNITIIAPTNDAFSRVLQGTDAEALALQQRDVVSISAFLRLHVLQGYYPSSTISEVPTFAQSLVMPDEQNETQPFTAMSGGEYNGIVKNGDGVEILSGEFSVSKVVEADIRVGDGIVVHKVDKALQFGQPLTGFSARYGYTGFNAAYIQSGLDTFSGIEINSASQSPVTDVTVFIPVNEAFESISSLLAISNQSTLQDILTYHVIQDNIIFSPSLSNTTAQSVQGADLTFTVTDDGSIFVNEARVILPNLILYEGVAHVIDSVLNPLVPFDRSELDPNAAAADRVQFEGATSSTALPFTSLTFASDTTFSYTIAPIFSTAPAVSITPTTAIPATTTEAANVASNTVPAVFTGAASHPGRGFPVAGAVLLAVVAANLV